ncbi:hypothetical protein M885DRAFT_252578 [Pelagophyceae sp. CCMP2097]|nr:hypothetical protein M885DRAFT_252578 [Pelagophyceae sp. CCMP2097]
MEEPVADVEGFKKYLVELARENEALAAKVQTLEGRLAEERASATDRKRKIKGYVAQLDAEKVQLEQTVASLRDKVYHAEHEAQSTAADLAKTREDLVKAKAEGARRVPKTAPAIVAAFDEGAFDADGGARPASPVKRKKKKAPSSPTSGMRLVKMGDFEGDDSDDDDDLSKAANLCRSFCAAQRAEMEALKGQVVKLVDLHRRSAALAVSVSQKKGVEHAEAAAASTAAYEARLYLGGLNVANQVQSLKAFCAAERGGLEALRAAVRSLGDSNRDAAAAAVALAQQQDARHRDEAVAAEAARDARESVLREAADAARDERAREAALGAEAAREAEAREGHLREAVATAEAARVAEVAEAKRLADMMTLEAAIEAAHLLDVAQLDSNRLADLADLKASFEAKRVADAETLEAARLADVATEMQLLSKLPSRRSVSQTEPRSKRRTRAKRP